MPFEAALTHEGGVQQNVRVNLPLCVLVLAAIQNPSDGLFFNKENGVLTSKTAETINRPAQMP